MTSLRQWLGRVKYHDVRHVESLAPVRLPHGGRLRGLRLTPDLYLGRDKRFYFIVNFQIVKISDEAVLQIFALPALRSLWKSATRRQARRMPAIKAERRRVVASRGL